MSASLALAFGAGLVATVNPCGFAMLPSFLTFFLGAKEEGFEHGLLARVTQGLIVGTVLSGAFAGVFLIVGLIVSAGLRSLIDVVPWVAVVMGVGLAAVGVAILAGRHIGLRAASRVNVRDGGKGDYRRVAVFGATYAVASLSCTLGLFLVVVGQALAANNPISLLAVFGAYGAGSASLLLALSLSAALAKGALTRRLQRLLPVVNRVSGALLLVSGAYLVAYWLPTLGSGTAASDSWAARLTRGVSSALADFFGLHTGVFALGLGALVVLGSGVMALNARGRRRTNTTDAEGEAIHGDHADCCLPEEPVDVQPPIVVVGQAR